MKDASKKLKCPHSLRIIKTVTLTLPAQMFQRPNDSIAAYMKILSRIKSLMKF